MPNAMHHHGVLILSPKGSSSHSKCITLMLTTLAPLRSGVGQSCGLFSQRSPCFWRTGQGCSLSSVFSWMAVQFLFPYCYSSCVCPHMYNNTNYSVLSTFYECVELYKIVSSIRTSSYMYIMYFHHIHLLHNLILSPSLLPLVPFPLLWVPII